ncbi:MAG: hypothetical protein ACYTHM_15765 [Planctomycetota bacterium]|jgi:hypothetical protein
MRPVILPTFALAICLAGTASAQESTSPFPWDHRGYRSILDASPIAKEKSARILVGLSGGPT